MAKEEPKTMTNFTPIKNEILVDVFIKGKLTYRETRIALYMIRNSSGYSSNGTRQKWTKQLSVIKIAKDIGLSRCKCSTTINQMVKEKKLFKKGCQYQFNEHYEEWVLPNGNSDQLQKVLLKGNSVTKSKQPEVLPNRNGTVTKTEHKRYQKVTVVLPNGNNQPLTNTDENKANSHPKDTLKETIKDNIKENILSKDRFLKKDDSKIIKDKDLQLKEKELKDKESPVKKKMTKEQVKQCIALVLWFSGEIMHIDTPDKVWTAREMRHAYRLLFEMNIPAELIKKICLWRIKDSFWRVKFHSLGSITSHLTDWIGEAKIKPLSFTNWLDMHPEEDYRKEENEYVRASRYLMSFQRARKDKVIFTSEEIRKKTVAMRMSREEANKYVRRTIG